MKKNRIIFIVSLFFVVSAYSMAPEKEKQLFESFKAKCKDSKINRSTQVRVELIKASSEEVCAIIHNLPGLSSEFPRTMYEDVLKQLIEIQKNHKPTEYEKLVSQLAHIILHRHQSSKDYIRPLIVSAIRIQYAQLENENNRLRQRRLAHSENNETGLILSQSSLHKIEERVLRCEESSAQIEDNIQALKEKVLTHSRSHSMWK